MDNVSNHSLYGILDNEQKFDVRNVLPQSPQIGVIARELEDAGCLGDDQLVGVGDGHLLLLMYDTNVEWSPLLTTHNITLQPSVVK